VKFGKPTATRNACKPNCVPAEIIVGIIGVETIMANRLAIFV
jgi:hypothetical protein